MFQSDRSFADHVAVHPAADAVADAGAAAVDAVDAAAAAAGAAVDDVDS